MNRQRKKSNSVRIIKYSQWSHWYQGLKLRKDNNVLDSADNSNMVLCGLHVRVCGGSGPS